MAEEVVDPLHLIVLMLSMRCIVGAYGIAVHRHISRIFMKQNFDEVNNGMFHLWGNYSDTYSKYFGYKAKAVHYLKTRQICSDLRYEILQLDTFMMNYYT